MLNKFYPYRFELFLSSQIAILFGSLFIPLEWFEIHIMPVLLLVNLASGVILVSKGRVISMVLLFFLTITGILSVLETIRDQDILSRYLKLGAYIIFYCITTVVIIKQVMKAKVVGKNVIMGLVSGYISLGLLAFFLCLIIEINSPGSFSGLSGSGDGNAQITEELMYFSYITLMTIGYGDILPVTPIAQKASVFIGLMGQFYLVILTAIVVGKYINQQSTTS